MTNFSQKVIEEVFVEQRINSSLLDFINALHVKAEQIRLIEESKPIEVEVCDILPEIVEGETVEESVKSYVKKHIVGFIDSFYYPNKILEDCGEDKIFYFKIGDKFYELNVHCVVEWRGDWSTRKNVIVDLVVTSIIELTNYEIVKYEKNGNYYILNIPKK